MSTALITGATSGVGAAFADELAHRGYDLVIVARDEERLGQSASRLAATYGVQVETLRADLAQRSDVDAVAARLSDHDRPVDMLVNNAGFGVTTTLLDPDTSEHERALDVMCLAVLVLGGAAGRAMSGRGRGVILNVASLAAFVSQGGYSPVKAYVWAYSQGLANELHGSGVTVTALAPGWVRTEFHQRAGIRTSSIPDWVWVDAGRVAREALDDAEAGKVVSIPTRGWKLSRFLMKHAPDTAVRLASRILTNSRKRA